MVWAVSAQGRLLVNTEKDSLQHLLKRYEESLEKLAQYPGLRPDPSTQPPIHPLQQHLQYVGMTPSPEQLAQIAMPEPTREKTLWEKLKGIFDNKAPEIGLRQDKPGQYMVEPPGAWCFRPRI